MTGEKLKNIDSNFGISDSPVSQACKRLEKRLEIDRQIEMQVTNIKKRIVNMLEVETSGAFSLPPHIGYISRNKIVKQAFYQVFSYHI